MAAESDEDVKSLRRYRLSDPDSSQASQPAYGKSCSPKPLPLGDDYPVAAAALPCSSVQSTTRRITSPRLASKAAVTASAELELIGVAFSKRAVATDVRRGMRSKAASSTTVACGVPEASFSTWNFLRFDSSKKSVAKV